MITWWQIAISGVLVLVGFSGTILPFLPGLPVLWVGILLAGVFSDFQEVSGWFVAVTGLVAVVITLFGYWATVAGTKLSGASMWGTIGAILGALLGLAVATLPGMVLGAVVGAVLGELVHKPKEGRRAVKAGVGALAGFLAGSLMQMVVGVCMVIAFVLALVW